MLAHAPTYGYVLVIIKLRKRKTRVGRRLLQVPKDELAINTRRAQDLCARLAAFEDGNLHARIDGADIAGTGL